MRVLTLVCFSFLVLSAALTKAVVQPTVSSAARPHLQLVAAGDDATDHGADLYASKCSMCHQASLAGMPPVFPSLIGVTKRLSDADITAQIKNGKGKMPPVTGMSDDDIKALILFLKTDGKAAPSNIDAVHLSYLTQTTLHPIG
ncbi:cytochrome c [Granulicella sp. WH15]|uniref:c-type cytochrome n=1 Tax=Granulicella sp. WH15 TaxID=2602070 RepID=UPI001366E15D|nr:cytochrome c [Granulicella sp. WH15]QHN05131.1 cytochrome c [Granulicella sp. WH15]